MTVPAPYSVKVVGRSRSRFVGFQKRGSWVIIPNQERADGSLVFTYGKPATDAQLLECIRLFRAEALARPTDFGMSAAEAAAALPEV